MNEYKLQLTTELIYQLLKGKKLEQIFNNEIRFTILPPQEGVFITIEELNKIVYATNTSSSRQEICLRCGESKKDIKKDNRGCKSWGTYYKKHIYK